MPWASLNGTPRSTKRSASSVAASDLASASTDGGRSLAALIAGSLRSTLVSAPVPLPVEIRGEPSDGWVRVAGDLHPGDLLAASPEGLKAGDKVSTKLAGGAL